MDWFKTIGNVFKALTSNFALVVYAVLGGLWLFNAAMANGRRALDDFKFAVQEDMRKEFNNLQAKEILESQRKVLDAIAKTNKSQDEAMKELVTSGQKRDTQYVTLERKLRASTDAAVAATGETQGPQQVSPFMERALELLDESQPE